MAPIVTPTMRQLRWSGVAGVAAALAWTIGDALLLGNRAATAADFPHLETHIGADIVDAGRVFLFSSTPRLAWGALVAVFTTPLYLAGVWHLYLATESGGRRWAVPPFWLLVTGYSIAPFVHGSFFYVAEVLKTIPEVDAASQLALVELAKRVTGWLVLAYAVLAVPIAAGFAWLTAAIALGKTLYPRWVAFANPLVCMFAASWVDRVLPDPLSMWLSGAGLNLGMVAFFGLSTALLWRSDRRRVSQG
jgi:hypothetical protein